MREHGLLQTFKVPLSCQVPKKMSTPSTSQPENKTQTNYRCSCPNPWEENLVKEKKLYNREVAN